MQLLMQLTAAAMVLLLQPADALRFAPASVVRTPASLALSPLVAPRSSIMEMGRVRGLI